VPDNPCETPEARQFDFWLGEWDLTWPAEQTGGVPGQRATGSNHITRLFQNCVIEENFATADRSFLGHSVSVYDEQAGIWRQTWVDSAGGYITLTGGFDGERMELATEPRDDGMVFQRMVFHEIEADSLEWAWQGTRDGGVTWNDLWNISYQRTS
jgi:hypothetical protein